MKKNLLLFVFVCCIYPDLFANFNCNSTVSKIAIVNLEVVASPPLVSSPIYYCQGSVASALTATASPGGTLNWYGTSSSGGIASVAAPTPSTALVGTTSYYVSETVAGIESTRSKIDVIVVANSGATVQSLVCDPSQVPAAEKNSAVFFDWGNNPLTPGGVIYNYSYTILGGGTFTGQKTNASTNLKIPGLLPGQSVTLTITSVDPYPCVPPQSATCSVPCITTSIPNFPAVPPFCTGTAAPILSSTSPNGIVGTWSPAVIDNLIGGSYVFTPDPILFPCATTQTLVVTVGSFKEPDFVDLAICFGSTAPNLNIQSPNGITGTWSPAFIDNTLGGTYDFTPDPGQCATSKSIKVDVNPLVNIVSVDWTVTEAFADNQVISIVASPMGNYLYQLDDGPFQEDSSFEYVAYGLHSITVKDIYGCSLAVTVNNIRVVNYPKFFTPNGDNFNDTWNIFELQDDLSSKIYIFDRYGKLVKEIRPNGNGWNGTYNGRPLPADDYWFVVNYTEQNIRKEFKSHFSLKR
ncbi:T9SS type B sorting domain-containing protein [Flavobacterium sp. W1B]|uniref:T9SS type B sorting domain-containing protein n=1 Tax=Flavobacterium sp. W1B TaxID=3394146 RepID=UPI0039BC22CB